VKLGDAYYWIGNFPFSFLVETLHKGIPISNHGNINTQPRPSRLTISRIYKKLVKDLAKHNLEHTK